MNDFVLVLLIFVWNYFYGQLWYAKLLFGKKKWEGHYLKRKQEL